MHTLPERTPILVVDDDTGLLLSIKAILSSTGLPEPALISDSRQVREAVRTHRYRLVLLDLNMPHVGGLELLQQIKAEFPEIECVVVTAIDDAVTAVEAMKYGAYDYLVKPVNGERLLIVVNRALERYNLRHEIALYEERPSYEDLTHPQAFADMVAADPAMAMVFRQVEVVAPTDYSVIVSGESGTGKEMLARILHALSDRAAGPFLAVNMAAFSRTVFEDAFFGHAKGAYTDAHSDKIGFFEAARGGTLFLDEITELDVALQGKLLRVLEERELYRLGSTQVRDVDVRILCATNRDIRQAVREGRFRADLFHRLNTYGIRVPPLRERPADILPLARHFLKRHAARNVKPITDLSPDLARRLSGYAFPGNVRELENLIAAAVLLENGPLLRAASMPELLGETTAADAGAEAFETLEALERRHIARALELAGGNRGRAAELLGVNPSTVYRKIQKYGLSLGPAAG